MEFAIFPYALCCTFDQDSVVPHYPASMLRGAFGYALKQVSCMLPKTACEECPLKQSCPYIQVFQPQILKPHIATPYLIQPIHLGKQVLDAHQSYVFHFTLLGEAANAQLPLLIYAWQKALKKGLGKQRMTAQLSSVKHLSSGQSVWQKGEEGCMTEVKWLNGEWDRLETKTAQQGLQLQIQTPLRLTRYGKRVGAREFHFSLFLLALQRRLAALQTYIPNLPQLTDEQVNLADLAQAKNSVQWHDWSRYSNHQQQKMTLGGLMGEMQVQFEKPELLETLLPALWLGQFVNLGKNTVFGMGHYQLNWKI